MVLCPYLSGIYTHEESKVIHTDPLYKIKSKPIMCLYFEEMKIHDDYSLHLI